MHPATFSDEDLLRLCEWSTLRRGGPGGQHRNKVETAVILRHLPTGLVVEANERRSQGENRRAALARLRLKLAVEFRVTSPTDHPLTATNPSSVWCAAVVRGRIQVSENSASFPAMLAELLDFLHAHDYSLATAADRFQTSASQLIKLLKRHHPALAVLNAQRQTRGLGPLS